MIFDIKMDKNFRYKTQTVSGGHETVTPVVLIYLLVIPRDNVPIVLTIVAIKK